MRIAFIGKGGSGKTTLSSAFCLYCEEARRSTLAFDVDMNTHLHTALGFTDSPRALIPRAKEVFQYVEPLRPELMEGLGEIPFIGCLPPSKDSRLIDPTPEDPFIREFGSSRKTLSLLTAGTYGSSDAGLSCYHGKLFSSQLVAHRIVDAEDQVIVFDATAGTDPLSTSLFLAYDLHLLVVEPTERSVSVFLDYVAALPSEVPVKALINKVRSESDVTYLKSKLDSRYVLGEVPFSRDLRAFEQGDKDGVYRFVAANKGLLELILEEGRKSVRPRKLYLKKLQEWFEYYSARWYDPVYGKTLGALTRESALAFIDSL